MRFLVGGSREGWGGGRDRRVGGGGLGAWLRFVCVSVPVYAQDLFCRNGKEVRSEGTNSVIPIRNTI